MFWKAHKLHYIVFKTTIIGVNTFKLSNANELELSVGQSLYQNLFITMWAIPSLFKILTNFSLLKFDELVTLNGPHIQTFAQSIIGKAHIVISN
jgi:hypothetical protein